MAKNRASKVKNGILVAIVLFFIIAIIGATYSRYISIGTANTTAEIAKWHVTLNNSLLSDNTNVNVAATKLEGVSNNNVSEGKIAPGQTLGATLEVNPTGSEVAIDYILNIGEITTQGFNSNSNIRISKVEATINDTTTELSKVNSQYIFYESLEDVLAGNEVVFKTYVYWDDVNNDADTENGAGNVSEVIIPINVTARQHLESDGFISVVSVDTVTELEAAIDNLSSGDTLAFPKNVNYEGNYAANAYHQIELPKNFTLDLNGNELASTNGSILFAEDGLTIKNGTLKGLPDSYGRTYTCIWDYAGETPHSNMTIENVVADGGLNLYNLDNIILRNVTATATKYYAIFCNESVTLRIESGTYSTSDNSTALFGYLGEYKGERTNPDDGFKIYGGTFNTNGKPFCLLGGTEQVYIPPVIYGGTFDCDVSAYVAPGHTCTNQGNGTWIVE